MRIFDKVKGYATQDNAIKAARKVVDLDKTNWMMTVNTEGRFQVALKGREHIHLAHTGKVCVTD